MITFFSRAAIVIIGIALISFFAGFNAISFFAAVLFVCAWVSARSFHDVFWWIVFYAVFYSVMHYDVFGVYFLSIVGAAYIFDFTKRHVARSGYESGLSFCFLSVVIASVFFIALEVIYGRHFFVDINAVMYTFFVAVFSFFALRWGIARIERFIGLYVYGADMKCHT